MKLIAHRYLHGVSAYHPLSGLALNMQAESGEQGFWSWRPLAAEAETVMASLRRIFPAAGVCADLRDADRICRATVPAVELLLRSAASVLADFCVRPAAGHLIASNNDQFMMFMPCEDPDISIAVWKLIARLPTLFCGPSISQPTADVLETLSDEYWSFRHTARQLGMNQTNIALARAAWKRGIPYWRLPIPGQHLQLGQGRQRQRIIETVTERTSALARSLSSDKFATASLLSACGVPTPGSQLVATAQEAVRVAQKLGYPVVVKPRASGKGKGVSVNLGQDADVIAAFEAALKFGPGVIVERFIAGEDHRILVVAGRFLAAAQRRPAAIIGDGVHTVREHVAALNRDPRRGLPFERLMEWVEMDAEAHQRLAEQGLPESAIPEAGRQVLLRGTANLSRGGTSIDLTERTHADNRALMERVARLVGLDVTGIDFLTPDVSRSWREVRCAVLEVNASPGLRPHLAANPERDVVGPIIDHLFPGNSDGRVPTAGITGSVGKTTTCRMVASVLAEAGLTVALSTTQGAYIGAEQVRSGDSSGGRVARNLLLDPRVEAGVFELARGALLTRGMALDDCDVGVVLNVYDNHVGTDGIRNRDDLARIKRLVVAHARKLAILNADDPLCLAMRSVVSAPRLCLASTAADNAAVLAHRAAGGFVAYLEGQGQDRQLVLQEGSAVIGSLSIAEIPATLDGRFNPAICNALFASATAVGMGVDFRTVRAALRKFQSTHDSNPGRMNFFEGLPFQLLINKGGGPQAVRETARYVQQLGVSGRKILLLTTMGNRPDSFIGQSATMAARCFSHYICADAEDLRGRPVGAVAQLLAQFLHDAGTDRACIEVIANHDDAIRAALTGANPGDLIVILTYSTETAWNLALAHRGAMQARA